ncbi:MAG: D-alanine--D-alanine ligase family protein [Chloroflexota bacterium]
MSQRIRVGVLFGGRSGEHEVSLASAESILRYIDGTKYEVVPIGITREGRWLASGDPLTALKAGLTYAEMSGRAGPNEVQPAALLPDPVTGGLVTWSDVGGASQLRDLATVDVVFPVLHGTFGEDGTIQGLLEIAGLPYVGAGVLGSSLGMDKGKMKWQFRARGLPVADFLEIRRSAWERDPEPVLDQVEHALGLPAFIKPARLGSSVGVSKARTRTDLRQALGLAAEFDDRLIAEEAIDARELECSVLGNDEPRASVVGEIIPARDFYDYESKYLDEGSQLISPAEIDELTSDEIRAMAIRSFEAVDCSGMARVDFFLERGSNRVLVNEINTIPGFTNISMYPKLWEATGLSYGDLIDQLIQLALERHKDRARNRVNR